MPTTLTTTENLERPVPIYTTWSATGLRGKRIGVLRDMFRKGDVVQAGNALIEKQLELMRAQGAHRRRRADDRHRSARLHADAARQQLRTAAGR